MKIDKAELAELTKVVTDFCYGNVPDYRDGRFYLKLHGKRTGGYMSLARARELRDEKASKPSWTPKFAAGDKVTLLANKAEGWPQQDAVVTEAETKPRMYVVELEEVTEPDDDGYREVSEDQMIARK